MHIQRILLAILSLLCCLFILIPWAEVPMLGTIKGFNNGTGIFSLFCSGVILVISLVTGNKEKSIPSGTKLTIAFLGIGIGICTIIFYSIIKDTAMRMINSSKISMFGTSIGSIWDSKDFTIEPGLYLTAIISLLLIILAIAFNSNINKISKAEINEVEIFDFDKTELINQLDKITSLHEKGILDNEIFEDEKNKILNKLKHQKNEIVTIEAEEQIDTEKPISYPTIKKNKEFLYVILSLIGLGFIGLILYFTQRNNNNNFLEGKSFKSYVLEEDGKIGNDSIYIQTYDFFTSDTTLISIKISEGKVVLRVNSKYKIQDDKILYFDSINKFDIVFLKEDSILLKSNDGRKILLVQTDKKIGDFEIDINSNLTVEEFEFDSLYKIYSSELSTETSNYSLKNGKENKLVFVGTDKAYMKINKNFEILNFVKTIKSEKSNFGQEYENQKYIVQVVGNSVDDKNAVIEGATNDEGKIWVFNKDTKEQIELELIGYSGE